jgi:hypothetical protein
LPARKQGAEENQYYIRHDESSFGQGSQEINDSHGLQGFRYRQVFGDDYYYYYYTDNALFLANAGTTLTIGPGITIRGQNGTIGYGYQWGGPQNVSVINQGTISCDVSGGTIGIDAQPFSNQGVLNAPFGTLLFSGDNNFAANSIGVGISGPGSNGQISFSGNAALASLSLNVFLTNGYLPTASNTNTFTVVTYGSLGSFLGNLTLPATGPLWQGIYGPTSFTLTTTNAVTPAVYLFAPANYAVLRAPTNVTLLAYATNNYYPITEVDFLHEGTLIGIATTSPYSITWTNPPGAVYSLTALAKDANGGTAVSAPVFITVLPGVSGSNYVWTGSVSSDWFNPANWSPAGVPGAQDAATINGGSPTLTADVNIASLFLNGGNLYGSSSLFVGNTLDWASGSISCPVTVLTNAAMNWISSSTLYLYSAIINAGTINWYLGGNLNIYNYSGYSYTGSINNLAGGAFNVQCDANMNASDGYEYFNNAGAFTKVQSTNLTRIYTAFTNSGSVLAQNGTIYFAGGGSLGGSFQASNNASVNLASGTWTGSGTVLSGVLNFSGSTINGSLTVSSNAVLNWSGGDLEGALTVAQGGVLTISNTVYFAYNNYNYDYTNTATLTNYGTVVWAGTISASASWPSGYGGGGIIYNAGLWESVANNSIGNYYGNPTTLFLNAGTLEKTGGTGTDPVRSKNSNRAIHKDLQEKQKVARGVEP